ncbi:MAG TPA: TraB/GumN family protein [Thermoplasmatales archaeon]|nr:TraB/GumN family protein [Thermoplasmatales archaeon]
MGRILVRVKIGNDILLVGTAHVSKDSVEEVKSAIKEFKPDVVAVELCRKRYQTLTEKEKWEDTPITSFLQTDKAFLILAQTFLASVQRKLGEEFGSEPGAEMLAAIEEAKKQGLRIELVDRDISVTLKRAWKKMGVREKFRLVWEFIKAMVGYNEEELEEIDLKELMKEDVMSAVMKEFSEFAPSVSNVLIDERNKYIAKKILDAREKHGKVLAVVGAGHVKGIKEYLEGIKPLDVDIEELEQVPRRRISIAKLFAYSIPVLFFSLIIYLIITKGSSAMAEIGNIFLWWFLINGSLSALGALLARAHPLSIVTAFLAAPLTSLNPAVAAGWFAGLVELKFRTPKIKDFQKLREIESLRDFFNNSFTRLLMVVAFANIGSTIGTFIALTYILKLGLG